MSAPARCATETALWDLRARGSDEEAERGAVECNATLVAAEPAAAAEDALHWREAEFGTFKLKLGTREDVGQVEAVREAIGPAAKIRVDANAAWSLDEARRIVAAIEPLGSS